MMERSFFLAATLASICLFSGACKDEQTASRRTQKKDARPATALDQIKAQDGGVLSADGQVSAKAEAGGAVVQGGLCDGAKIGKRCAKDADCASDMACLMLSVERKIGVCTCEATCVIENKAGGELDDCPAGSVCGLAAFSETNMRTACLKLCDPKIGANDCAAGVACDPFLAEDKYGLWRKFVCGKAACEDGLSCPVFSNAGCTADAECDAIKAGAVCVSGEGDEKYCALPGKCDAASGLCDIPSGVGDPNKEIGAPCGSSWDCAPGQTCMKQSGERTRNGYCTIVGCNAETLSSAECGDNAYCNHFFNYGACFKKCDINSAGDCRGLAADKFGDYECFDWSALNKNLVAGPTCEPANLTTCAEWGAMMQNPDPCPRFASPGNPNNMRCRLLDGSDAPSKVSPEGFCLDGE